jgi:5-hydroxyisourate hydrolase
MAQTGRLTTHVLDTANGIPAVGMEILLYRISGVNRELLKKVFTNADGRCDAPLLEGDSVEPGFYELVFGVGAYFEAKGTGGPDIAFLDAVPVRFGISDISAHYHVPLLVSPFAYSTYRGS